MALLTTSQVNQPTKLTSSLHNSALWKCWVQNHQVSYTYWDSCFFKTNMGHGSGCTTVLIGMHHVFLNRVKIHGVRQYTAIFTVCIV